MSEQREAYCTKVLQTSRNPATMEQEQSRRALARGLDELEREATQFERALLQMLNQVRAVQGKRPVIVPKG